ncbi:winged helix DNA-binding domain-containing protein [Gordonia alkaliphila]|uniref:winged helix DNA-binding domain-containing protein n=1 Tax=Gordonia alkaliphila TaxID=1053547 RepID=UPI001FF2ED82|nr:winged helix DNA-binding domain-containing protein [Gordonia alkaliphila]MCK0439102.1 winged helix DNA-binding domain-containing protein [Gordonia alkaliphila]
MAARVSAEQANRTLLHRQHLLERADEDAIEVIDRCVGLQAQDPQAPFFALWSRIADFDPGELDELLLDRETVRMPLQRGTVFLMDALDARWIRPAVQAVFDAALARTHLPRLGDVDVDEVVALARTEFAEHAAEDGLSGAALRAALNRRWPQVPAEALAAVVRGRLPLVQTPPRGLWGRSGAPAFRLLDDWIGPGEPAVTDDEARKDLIRMYLRGFGPASAKAIAGWTGLTGLTPFLKAMDADWEVVTYVGPDGGELYDLEGLSLVDGEVAAPVRLIAPFDQVLVANADRDRIAAPEVYRATVTPNGRSPGFVLVDGRLVGTWQLVEGRVELTELVDVQPAQRAEVEREAAALADFAAR